MLYPKAPQQCLASDFCVLTFVHTAERVRVFVQGSAWPAPGCHAPSERAAEQASELCTTGNGWLQLQCQWRAGIAITVGPRSLESRQLEEGRLARFAFGQDQARRGEEEKTSFLETLCVASTRFAF